MTPTSKHHGLPRCGKRRGKSPARQARRNQTAKPNQPDIIVHIGMIRKSKRPPNMPVINDPRLIIMEPITSNIIDHTPHQISPHRNRNRVTTDPPSVALADVLSVWMLRHLIFFPHIWRHSDFVSAPTKGRDMRVLATQRPCRSLSEADVPIFLGKPVRSQLGKCGNPLSQPTP